MRDLDANNCSQFRLQGAKLTGQPTRSQADFLNAVDTDRVEAIDAGLPPCGTIAGQNRKETIVNSPDPGCATSPGNKTLARECTA